MSKMYARPKKRLLAMLLAFVLTASLWMIPITVKAAEPTAFAGNLLVNPSFETGTGGTGGSSTMPPWEKIEAGRSGRQNNNRRTGSYGFFVDNGTSNGIKQTVVVPYNGYYNVTGYIAAGATGGVYSLRTPDGEILSSLDIPAVGSTPDAYLALPQVELSQGDEVVVQVNGGGSWINGDDLSLEYATYRVDYNLLKGYDFSADASYSLYLPWAGDYDLTATATAGGSGMTVALGSDSVTLGANETDTIKLTDTADNVGDSLIVTISGGTLADASLKLDVSTIPNDPPSASNVEVVWRRYAGDQLAGSYTFTDPDAGQVEGGTLFRWLMSDTADGAYEPIAGAEASTYDLTDASEGKYYKFEVTPCDSYGLLGDPVLSEPVGPHAINWVRNPSMDIESGGSPVGWATTGSGASIPNSSANAHTGFRVGALAAGSTTGAINYTLTTERSAMYEVSAWLKMASGTGNTTIGVRNKLTGEVLGSEVVTATSTYTRFTVADIPIERKTEVQVFITGNTGASTLYNDDFELVVDSGGVPPAFLNLIAFRVEKQLSCDIDADGHNIDVLVPYGTDLSALRVTADFSDGTTFTPAGGSALVRNTPTTVDFSGGPVVFTLSGSAGNVQWAVSVQTGEKALALTSDNAILEEGFNWAVNKTNQFVVTGRDDVPFEMWSGKASSGPITAEPSYWAGYYNRSAYYSRDFVHQASGAELVGLSEENFRMFEAFAKASTAARKWYTYWAINFDNATPLGIDYRSDTNFVREVPAQFELVEKAYKQYLWSADERYLSEEMMTFYGHVMNEYIGLHDTNGNGVAEGDPNGGGIFAGSATYNERGSHPLEAGDSIGSQYQATLAYAGFLRATGDEDGYDAWMEKAAALKKYFNENWSVKSGTDLYVNVLTIAGVKEADFGKENSWFMPMKLITEPGERNEAYLDFIVQNLGAGIGSSGNAPNNIEAYTYIPDTYFAYNRADEAWKWMAYIIGLKDKPHEVSDQGTNGDYPEISFTFVSHTVEGMMGVEPDARLNRLSTVPRLPADVGEVNLQHLMLGDNELELTHLGNNKSTLASAADNAETITWVARFYGNYPTIEVNGTPKAAEQETLNGKRISYVSVEVAPGESATAETAADVPLTGLVLNQTSVAMEVLSAATATLTLSPTPANTTSDWFTIDWTTSDATVATVADGVITAVGSGTATITATTRVDGTKYTQSCIVTVTDKTALANMMETCKGVYEARCTPATWADLQAAITASQAVLDDDTATQTTIDNSLAALTAAHGALVDVPVAVSGVSVAPQTATVDVGGTTTLAANVQPVWASETGVSWSSGDPETATVDASGVVTGVKAGTVAITVTTLDGSFTDTCTVTVRNVPATGISVAPAELSLTVGDTAPLSVSFTPANTTDKQVTFASDAERIATVDAIGTVTAVAAGRAKITVTSTDGGYTATTVVDVAPAAVPPAPTVTLSRTTATLNQGEYVDITVNTTGPQGTTWSNSIRNVEVIPSGQLFTISEQGNGVLRVTASSTAYGCAWLRVVCQQDGTIFAECRITVAAPDIRPAWAQYHLYPASATVNVLATDHTVLTLQRDALSKTTLAAPLVGNSLTFVPAAAKPSVAQQKAVDTLNAHYTLTPLDDGRVQVQPRAGKTSEELQKLAASYKVWLAIDITYNGEVERQIVPEVLTLKLNKKAPSVKAPAIVINSWQDYRTAPIALTGHEIDTLELDSAKAAQNQKLIGTDVAPGWLDAEDIADGLIRVRDVNAAKKGTLYLRATLKGWSGSYAFGVSVQAKATAPALKLGMTSIKLYGNPAQSEGVTFALQSKNSKVSLASMGVLDLVIVPWDEITAAKDRKTYALNENPAYTVTYDSASASITVTTSAPAPLAGSLLLGAVVEGSGELVRLPLKIGVTSAPATVKLTPSAKSLTLNANLTGGDGATITLKPSVADLLIENDDVKYTIQEGSAVFAPGEEPLQVLVNGRKVTVSTVDGKAQPGKTYMVTLTLPGINGHLAAGKQDATATLTVKTVKAGTAATAKLSASGKVDLSTGTLATVTAKFSNYLGGYAEANPFTVTLGENDVTASFEFTKYSPTSWSVGLKAGQSLVAGKYKISATGTTAGGEPVAQTAAATLTVAATAPKATLAPGTVTLYSNDRYSEGTFILQLPDGAAEIRKVELNNAEKLAFRLDDLGNGRYALHFKDVSAAKTSTLTLNIWLKGNNAEKPHTTARLKVTVVQFK